MAASKDIARTADSDGVIDVTTQARPANQFRAFIERETARQQEDGGVARAIADGQLDRMMTAEDEEGIWESDAEIDPDVRSFQGRDLDGVSIEIAEQEFRFNPSSDEFKTNMGSYIQFEATIIKEDKKLALKPGEQILISTGSDLVIGKIMAFRAKNMLPIRATIQQVEGTKGVLRLRKFVG